MIVVSVWISASLAGDVFVVSQANAVNRINARNLSTDLVGGIWFDQFTGGNWVRTPADLQYIGGSFDPRRDEFIIFDSSYGSKFTIDIVSGNFVTSNLSIITQALAFDPVTQRTIAFGYYNQSNAWDLSTGISLFDPGIMLSSADWFDDGGYIVGRELNTGDFYRVEAGMTIMLAPSPPIAHPSYFGGLAYDRDTRLFWWFGPTIETVLLIEPQTWSVVGALYADLVDGAGGSIDTVLPQTPELLVTGACPGTVYLTVVDATPGQHVQFASGTTPGTRTVRRGPCAGVQGDLQNPTPRFDLIANDYGIASTTIQATAPMCGAGLVQAIDVATCLTTSVRTIPDGPLMLSL
jgi:hypothetical protein